MTRPTSMNILLTKCANLRGCEMMICALKVSNFGIVYFKQCIFIFIYPFKRKHHLVKISSPVTAVLHIVVKLFGGITGDFSFLCLRFLGNAPFQKSWPVSVRDPGNLQVDFFKSQYRQERRRSLCTLYIIPRSPVQVLSSFPI